MTYYLHSIPNCFTSLLYTPRGVLKHSSAHQNQVKIRKDDLMTMLARPLEEHDYSETTMPSQFRTLYFLVRMSKTPEIPVLTIKYN